MRRFTKNSLTAFLAVAVLCPVVTPAHADDKEWKTVPTSFQFTGAGWGHGVGMSQYGARGMAQEGKSANQILEHYYNPAKVEQETKYASSDIRVQVLNASTASMSVTNGRARVLDGKTTRTASSTLSYKLSGSKLAYAVDGKQYTTSNKITVQWEGTRAWDSSKKAILSVQRANDGWGAVGYRHGFMTVQALSGKVNVVNQLRLNDEYLYGLAEVPSSWETATLQAQAVAGRTYAMRNMSSLKKNCDCNVYDEVASQKFTAWNKENEAGGTVGVRWKAAVDKTLTRSASTVKSAKVVKYKGGLIDAVYSSSTGGKTRAAKSVWGGEHAYLQSRDDSWALKASVGNPNSSWTRSISQATARAGFGLSDIVEIKLALSSDKAIASATATSKDGKTSTVTGSKLRSLIGAKAAWVLKSTAIGGTYSVAKPEYTSVPKNIKYKTTANLNLREEPVDGAPLVVLAKGAEVTTVGRASEKGSWLEITNGKRVGWASKAYLEEVKTPAASKPVASPKPATPKPPVKAPAPTTAKPKTTTKKVTTHTTTTSLNLRNKAVSGKVIATMKKGAKVTPTGKTAQKGAWIQVKFGNQTGWASKKYIKSVTTTVKTTVKNNTTTKAKAKTKTTAAKLNLRAGASTKNKVLITIPKNTKIAIEGSASKSGWIKATYKSKKGYVSTAYLK